MNKFECYKSFNETFTYSNDDGEEVVISNLWRYAELLYPDDQLPVVDSDRNYCNIELPEEFEYSDLYVNNVDVFVNNEDLREQIESYDDENFEELLEDLGFTNIETEYDIFFNGEDSIKISKI